MIQDSYGEQQRDRFDSSKRKSIGRTKPTDLRFGNEDRTYPPVLFDDGAQDTTLLEIVSCFGQTN